MDIKPSWVFFTEWATTIATFLICFMFLYSQINALDRKIDRQSERTDKLYEMFIDLVKEVKRLP